MAREVGVLVGVDISGTEFATVLVVIGFIQMRRMDGDSLMMCPDPLQ